MPIASLNGANLYYDIQGLGEPLVLITGYNSDHTGWLTVYDDLVQRYQVLLLDNRGAGQTTDDGTELTAKVMADDVMALCRQLELQKPHIVGMSMGGTVAQTIARDYGDDINKLILIATTSKWRFTMLEALESIVDMREQNVDFDLIFRMANSVIFGDAFLQDTDKMEVYRTAAMNPTYPQSIADMRRQFNVLREFDSREWLKDIKNETLVCYGKTDFLSMAYEAAYLTETIANARSVEFDCGHGIPFEQTKKLVQTMLNFLA